MDANQKDSWSTPQWLYNWLNWNNKFDVDLCASESNHKHKNYITKEMDSLKLKWTDYGKTGFCNPPYSDISPWIDKAIQEAKNGFVTIMLIPTPNGESYYSSVFDEAHEVTYIDGRIAFIAPCDYVIPGKNGKPDKFVKKGDEVSGNTRGSSVFRFAPKRYIGFNPDDVHGFSAILVKHESRDFIKKCFGGS